MRPHLLALHLTGKARSDGQLVVYQRAAKGFGNLRGAGGQDLQLRAYVAPANPQTPAQTLNRQRHAAATAAWQALPPEERASWNARAARQPRSGFNLFVRAYRREHG